MRDRRFNQELIDRAATAQCSALMLTLDLQVIAERRRDPRNGLTIPPRLTLRNAFDVASKPVWALKVLFGKRRNFGNLVGRGWAPDCRAGCEACFRDSDIPRRISISR